MFHLKPPDRLSQQCLRVTPTRTKGTPHFDLAFSQARGRFIFGGNAEAIFRTDRDGFRLGLLSDKA